MTLEFDNFFVVNAYVPNAGADLKRLPYRQTWDAAFREYLCGLDKRKPVVLAGDLNVSHKEIDLARPASNTKFVPFCSLYFVLICCTRSAGFTIEERNGFSDLLAAGFADVHRSLNPDAVGQYTYYSYRFQCYAKNLGWRLDYFVVSSRLLPSVHSSFIRRRFHGPSDHVPLGIWIKL